MQEKFALLTESDLNELLIKAARAGAAEFAATVKGMPTTAKQGDQQLISMKALCSELDLSRTSINKMVRAGTIKPERLPGSRRIYFKRSQILLAMEKNGRKR